jgi:hypothetical protein
MGADCETSEVIGSKPVVLVFGNFTCGPFRALIRPWTTWRTRKRCSWACTFASASDDGWRMASNDKLGVAIKQPATYDERAAVATKCSAEVFDAAAGGRSDDRVGHAYSGMPSRIYIIDRDGKVAYKGGRGPFGFKPGEAEQALAMLLLDQQKPTATTPAGEEPRPRPQP